MKKFIIKTQDVKKEMPFTKVSVFTSSYGKKINRNEFHSPFAARVVLQNDKSIFQFIILNSVITSDNEGNITIVSPHEYALITGEKKYFTTLEQQEAKLISKMLEQKEKLGLSVDEVIEYSRVKAIVQLSDVLKKKLPYEKGGGF